MSYLSYNGSVTSLYLPPRSGGSPENDVNVLAPLFGSMFGVLAQRVPDGVVVSIGGNSLACRTAPHAVIHDAGKVIQKVNEAVRRIVGRVVVYGAPEATVITSVALSQTIYSVVLSLCLPASESQTTCVLSEFAV